MSDKIGHTRAIADRFSPSRGGSTDSALFEARGTAATSTSTEPASRYALASPAELEGGAERRTGMTPDIAHDGAGRGPLEVNLVGHLARFAASLPPDLRPRRSRRDPELRQSPGAASPRFAVSIGGSPFLGPAGAARMPGSIRAAAELALLSGEVTWLRHNGQRWLVSAVCAPLPALVITRGSSRRAVELADRLSQTLSERILPALERDEPFAALTSSSPSLGPLIEALRRVARGPIPVLLIGETGTGKEVVARCIHRASRRAGSFVAENCAALPENLLEAELFGARRGAYTGADRDRRGRIAEADRGTLFLDEIGDLPAALQVKLLRTLQEQEVRPLGGGAAFRVDFRVIAATHHPLPLMVQTGRFRRDLYFRLAGLVCEIPPLRRRPGDLPYLVATLLVRLARAGIGPGRRLRAEALRALSGREFLGNVRELDNVLRRASALSSSEIIEAGALADDRPTSAAENLESAMIREALRLSHGVKAEAARRLGWSRQKLYRRLGVLGLAAAEMASPAADPRCYAGPDRRGT